MKQKWYLIFKTSKYLTKNHKEFLGTFNSEEHFSQWYVRNFPHRVYGNKINHFIDGVNDSCKLYGALRLSIFSYMPEIWKLNLWHEIKDAFPFFLYDRHLKSKLGKIIHDAITENLSGMKICNDQEGIEFMANIISKALDDNKSVVKIQLPGAIHKIEINLNFIR